jgi:hypothetical protein
MSITCTSRCYILATAVDLADSKIKRREAMERQLAEIEKDIRTLERGDMVLIVPDNGNGYGGCQYDC